MGKPPAPDFMTERGGTGICWYLTDHPHRALWRTVETRSGDEAWYVDLDHGGQRWISECQAARILQDLARLHDRVQREIEIR